MRGVNTERQLRDGRVTWLQIGNLVKSTHSVARDEKSTHWGGRKGLVPKRVSRVMRGEADRDLGIITLFDKWDHWDLAKVTNVPSNTHPEASERRKEPWSYSKAWTHSPPHTTFRNTKIKFFDSRKGSTFRALSVKQIPWIDCIRSSVFIFTSYQPQHGTPTKLRISPSHPMS